MCGRYSLALSAKKIHEAISPDLEIPELPLNYNVAPTQLGAVITNQASHRVDLFRWGLIPFWAKDPKMGGRMINARSEGIENKPAYRAAIRKRRCLVLADSFYEWKKEGKQKTPYRIYDPERPLLLLAGIWEYWKKEEILSYSVITTSPNQEMLPIHDRMPVIFREKEEWGKWLDDQPLEEILPMLAQPKDGILDMYPVNRAVGNVRNNGPDLHQRLE